MNGRQTSKRNFSAATPVTQAGGNGANVTRYDRTTATRPKTATIQLVMVPLVQNRAPGDPHEAASHDPAEAVRVEPRALRHASWPIPTQTTLACVQNFLTVAVRGRIRDSPAAWSWRGMTAHKNHPNPALLVACDPGVLSWHMCRAALPLSVPGGFSREFYATITFKMLFWVIFQVRAVTGPNTRPTPDQRAVWDPPGGT